MLTQKQILDNTIGKDTNLVVWITTGSIEDKLLSLIQAGMDAQKEVSKYDAMNFAKWVYSGELNKSWMRADTDMWELMKPCKTMEDRVYKRTDELYELYIQSKNEIK